MGIYLQMRKNLGATAFRKSPVAHEERQPNSELAQKNIVLAIRHIEHPGEIAGSSDFLALTADLHRTLLGVVEIEVWLSETESGANLDQSVGSGFGLAIVEDGEVAFTDAVEDNSEDRPIRAVRVRIPWLNSVGLEDDGEIVAKVRRYGIVEAVADEGLEFSLDDDLPAHRQDARQIGAIRGAKVNEIEDVAGKLGSIAGQDAFCKGIVEAGRLHASQLPLFQTFVLVQEIADQFDLSCDGG